MADAIYCADVLYPEYNDGDEIKEYVQRVSDYLFLLREGLGYTLDNLGINNFSPTSIQAIGDVIREPVMVQLTDQEGKLAEFSATLEGISSTVSEIDGNYVSSTSFTQTSGDFQFCINDGDNNAAVIMDAAGLTVYKGNIVIKNDDGTDVFYADDDGNLIMKGTIESSSVFGTQFFTCAKTDVSSARQIYIGSELLSGDPVIRTTNGNDPHGFEAVGSETRPYYALRVKDGNDDKRFITYYDTVTSTFITRMDGSHAYFGQDLGDAGLAYRDTANAIVHYININSTGITMAGDYDSINDVPLNYIFITKNNVNLWGNVYINGRTPVLN